MSEEEAPPKLVEVPVGEEAPEGEQTETVAKSSEAKKEEGKETEKEGEEEQKVRGSYPDYEVPKRPLTLLVLHGHEELGNIFIERALEAGHKVVALAEAKDGIKAKGKDLVLKEGDPTDTTLLQSCMEGVDAVATFAVSRSKPVEDEESLTSQMKLIVAAMRKANLWRLLVSSSIAVELKGDPPLGMAQKFLGASPIAGGRTKVKEEQDVADYLQEEATDINWTLLRQGKKAKGGAEESHGYPVVCDKPFHGAIAIRDSADLGIRLLATESNLPKAFYPGYDYIVKGDPRWVPDECANECTDCEKRFSTFVRKSHCRKCGFVLCSKCTSHGTGGWKLCKHCAADPENGRELMPDVKMTLTVRGIKSQEGSVMVAIVRPENLPDFLSFVEEKVAWLKTGNLRDATKESVDGKVRYSMTFEIPSFKAGFFAVVGLHDEDSTGEPTGITKWEHGLCASRNGFHRSIPKYGDCSLYVKSDTKLDMLMRYNPV